MWFFFYQGFLSQTLTIHDRVELLLFHSTTSIRSKTSKHLLTTLHVRWLPHIFDHTARIYQTSTQWDLPPYRITIWLIDWLMMQCSFVYFMIWFQVFVTAIWQGKPVDLRSHRLSQATRLIKCASHPRVNWWINSLET